MLKNLFLSALTLCVLVCLTACVSGRMTEEEYIKMLKLELAEQSDLTVEQLVMRMQEATDPLRNFENAKSYIMRQRIVSVKNDAKNSTKDEYTMEIKFKAPDRMRYTSSRHGKPFSIIVFNKDEAWTVTPGSNRYNMIPEGTPMNLVKAFADMIKPGMDVIDIFDDIKIGIIYREKEKFYRLICRVKDPAIAPYVIYIDGHTFLTRKLETIMYTDDGNTYLYDGVSENYTWMSNVRMASRSIVNTAGQNDVSTITDFILNADIHDSEFEKPIPFTHRPE